MDEEQAREQDARLREAIMAEIDPNAAAQGPEWYLPAAGLDGARYPDQQKAREASIRLCAIRGVPFVDPITVDEPFRD